MIDFRLFDPDNKPGEGFYWSTTLSKWRRKPAPFRWDRFGYHFPVGLIVGLSWLFMLMSQQAMIPVAVSQAIATWLFLKYETTESDVIFDEAYSDIAGMIVGYMIAVAISLCIVAL